MSRVRTRRVVSVVLSAVVAAAAATPQRAFAFQAVSPDSGRDSTGAAIFRNIGPSVAGGRVSQVVGIAGDPDTYYVGAAAGGVWKTTNGGMTWKDVFARQPVASIGAIALAPSNPNLVWVGTGEANIRNDVISGRGIYLSGDAGASWRFMGLSDAGQISRIIVDPHNPDRVFVAVLGNAWKPTADRGVYRTDDGGRTWKKVLFVNDTTGASDIVMQPGNPGVLFAAMWQVRRLPWELDNGGAGSAIYRSTDGGDSWSRLTTGLPDGPYGRIVLDIAPSNPTHVYALIEAKKGLLWESHDLGDHWSAVSDNHALDVRPFYFSLINVAPDDDRRIYFSSFQLMESDDGGKTARAIDARIHPDHHTLWIDPGNPSRMIQGNDGGVFLSTDRGRSWRFLNNLPIGQFYMVAADSRRPYYLCGGLQDNNAWCGPSNTLSGEGQNGAEWYTVTGGDGEYAVPAPSDSNIVYVDAQNGYITRVDLKTGVSKFIRPTLEDVSQQPPSALTYRFNWTSPIAVSPSSADEVFIGGNVLFKSVDGGAHWSVISPDVTHNDKSRQKTSGGPIEYDISGAETYNTILSITLAPTDTNVIWLGTDDGNVEVTRDGGKSWKNVRPTAKGLPPEGRVYQVGVSPFDAGTAYVTLDYHMFGDDRPFVFRTTNYGASWTSIAAGLPATASAHVVREDPGDRNFLLLGTDAGLWYSRDDGAHWEPLAKEFPTAPVFDVSFVRNTRALAVATHGRGLFVLDDVTPLEMLTDAVAKEALHVFPVEAATSWHESSVAGSPASESRVPNPPPGAVIAYSLSKALTATPDEKARHASPVRIDITNATGDTVYTGYGASKQGVNRFTWRLRYSGGPRPAFEPPPPPSEEMAEMGGGEPLGPLVVPGMYTVTVIAAGTRATAPVVVRADPRVPFDTMAARAQLRFGLSLRDDVASTTRMLNGLHSLRTQVANLEQTVRAASLNGTSPDTSALPAARALDDKVKALMDTVYDPRVQRNAPEDDIHYLQRFYDQLQGLGFALFFSYDEAPNAITQRRIAALHEELQGYLARYQALLHTDVPAFNTLAGQHGMGGVIAR